jgi:hypothetical protein
MAWYEKAVSPSLEGTEAVEREAAAYRDAVQGGSQAPRDDTTPVPRKERQSGDFFYWMRDIGDTQDCLKHLLLEKRREADDLVAGVHIDLLDRLEAAGETPSGGTSRMARTVDVCGEGEGAAICNPESSSGMQTVGGPSASSAAEIAAPSLEAAGRIPRPSKCPGRIQPSPE